MDVGIVAWPLGLRGGHRVILRHAEGLQELGHDVTIYIVDGKQRIAPKTGVRLVDLSMRPELIRWGVDGLSWASAARSMIFKSGEIQHHDCLLATWMMTVPISVRAARLHGTRCFWLLMDFPSITRGRFSKRMLQRLPRYVDGVVSISNYLTEVAVPASSDVPHAVVPPGVESVFHPSTNLRVLDNDQLKLMWVGDQRAYRRFEIFQQVARELEKAGTKVEARIVGPRILKDKDSFGCVVHSQVTDDEMANLYRTSDFFVSTSEEEGFGLPPLEAMACGLPCVIVDSGGSRDYAVHRGNCLVVSRPKPGEIVASLRELIVDEELRSRLVASGIETASRYRWPAMTKQFETALSRMLQETRNAG